MKINFYPLLILFDINGVLNSSWSLFNDSLHKMNRHGGINHTHTWLMLIPIPTLDQYDEILKDFCWPVEYLE